jgi:hypothetical protein
MLRVKTVYETDNGTVVEVTSPDLEIETAIKLHAAMLAAGREARVIVEGSEGAREVLT